MSRPPTVHRALPALSPMNDYFWLAGKEGVLKILHCDSCNRYSHPYVGRCPHCRAQNLSPKAVSGKGEIVGFTVNYQQWTPTMQTPLVIALIALDEQDDIRLLSDMPDSDPNDVAIGQPVEVYFQQQNDHFVPLFRPVGAAL